MALTKQLIPLSFYKGLSNKTDDKQGNPGDLLELENGVFTKIGKIKKRNGFISFPRLSQGGNISTGKALATYNEELIQFTGKDVLGFSESEQLWIQRGVNFAVETKTKFIINNNVEQKNPEMSIGFGMELYVFEDSSGGIRYSIRDHATDVVIVANNLVDNFGMRPKIVIWNSKFVVLYTDQSGLFARVLDPSAPYNIGPPLTLALDINTTGPQFDAKVNSNGVFGILYSQSANKTRFATVTSLSISGLSNSVQYDIDSTSAVCLFNDASYNFWLLAAGNQQFYVAGVRDQSNGPVSASFQIANSLDIKRVSGYLNTITGNTVLFYEYMPTYSDPRTYFGNVIHKVNVSKNGTIFSDQEFKRGLSLYSSSFHNGQDYFSIFTFGTTYQATYYLISEHGVIVDRCNINNGGGTKNNSNDGKNTGMVTDIVSAESGVYSVPLQIKTSILSNNNTQYLPTGINVAKFDFNTNEVFNNVNVSSNLQITGGICRCYDGINYVENNFLAYPEGFFVDSTELSMEVYRTGDDFNTQALRITFIPAYKIPNNSFFTIATINGTYVFWFRKDGIGTAPTYPGTKILVDIDSTATSYQVGQAVAAVIPTAEFVMTNLIGDIFSISNTFDGAVLPPSTGTVNSGHIAAGTYLYNVIYSWTDNNGVFQNGSTAFPVSISRETTGSIAIVVPTLRLTEKNNVRIQIYRTEGTNLGSEIFKRVSPLINPILNNTSKDWIAFIDTQSDESIASNDLLYTTGNVLDNASPPSSSFIVHYKNRVFLGGLENENLLWYSKYAFPGTAINFSEFLTFQCDPRGGKITGLGVLDGNLIIFKEQTIFYLAGNGPTDTGENNDYDNNAIQIATDVGCSNSNSIVQTPLGLIFKSAKGIYLLGRDLSVSYIGAGVEDYNNLTISSAIMVANKNQIRFSTYEGAMLVYDYLVGQWGIFTGLEGVDAVTTASTYYLLKDNGVVYKENDSIFTDDGKFIKLKITTSWLAVAGIQGFQRIWRLQILGSYYGKHNLQCSICYDYNNNPQYFTAIDCGALIGNNEPWGSDAVWGENDTVWGGSFVPYQFRIHLTKQVCEAIKFTFEDIQEDSFNEGYDLSNVQMEVGVKTGGYKQSVKNSFGNR